MRDDDQGDGRRPSVGERAERAPARPASPSTRLTAAKAEARKPEEVDADLDDRQEAARVRLAGAWTRTRARVALVDELLEPAAADR